MVEMRLSVSPGSEEMSIYQTPAGYQELSYTGSSAPVAENRNLAVMITRLPSKKPRLRQNEQLTQ